MKDFSIEPLKGYGDIPFGITLEEIVEQIGMPDFYEELSDMEETGNRSIYYEYNDLDTNIYLEGVTKSVVACFETENEAATLFGQRVFALNKKQLIDLMKSNGYTEMEEEEEDGEQRVTFEEGLIDFFFDADTLTAVSWGVLVDEQGEII